LLSLYEISNRITVTGMLMRAGDRIAPSRRIVRVPCEKVGDARVIEHVVGRKSTDPGKSPDIDGKASARRGIPASSSSVEACGGRQT
jgi:hypothetical protein